MNKSFLESTKHSPSSFLIPPALVAGRMSLLTIDLLMLVNISWSAREAAPVSASLSLLDLWLLACTVFVALALFEYAIVVKMKYDNKTGSSMSDRI